jgi:hypothetical protein
MDSGFGWGLWIATCLLIVGVAKFVDEYHVRNDIKSRVRDGLIAIFLFLDRPRIANFPGVLYTYLAAGVKRLGKPASIIAVFITYFAIVACFYFGRLLFNNPPTVGFLRYSLTWVNSAFWAIVVLWGICTGTASFITAGAFLNRWNSTNLLYRQWIISGLTLMTLVMIALGTAGGFFVIGSLNPELGLPGGIVSGSGILLVGSPLFLLALSMVCLWHAIALSCAMLVLTIFRSLYLIIHKIALSVLNAASSPMTSPFQYFAALVALCATTFKVIDELTK